MNTSRTMSWTFRSLLLLLLTLGFSASAWAQSYYRTYAVPVGSPGVKLSVVEINPCSYLPALPSVIYFDYGLQSGNYTSTEVRYWTSGGGASNTVVVGVPIGTVVYARSRILRTDGVWEVTPETSARASRWGGPSTTTCLS